MDFFSQLFEYHYDYLCVALIITKIIIRYVMQSTLFSE